jgi:5,10-methylenetetrahydromethanopterin reductase
MPGVGVIAHVPNLDFRDARALASEAEEAGADWLGLADAFWWRDTWMLLLEAARVTERIGLGPLVTNPYMRHPFHTVAAIATLQGVAGNRVFLGIGAGGSEVSGAAGISRRDAPEQIAATAKLLREVAAGQPLDARSGRDLEVPLSRTPVLIAGRATRVLEVAGRAADRALLWAVPASELERSAKVVRSAALASREAPGAEPELVWAPLVDGGSSRERVQTIAAYSVLNSRPELQARWGLSRRGLAELRRLLVGGGAAAAADLVPAAAIDDLIVSDASPAAVGGMAARIGATSLALPAFNISEVKERVAWARQVLAESALATSV